MHATSKVFVAGHRGLVGSAIVRRLEQDGVTPLTATRDELDLRNQAAVNDWFRANRPETVYLVAGTVGGILANSTRPAEFIYDNLMIHATVVHACHLYGTRKLLYLGSSCIYPREAPQPMTEAALLGGPLEPTNEFYAVAKIAGIKLCQAYRRQYGCNFISAMPTNLYGPNDNFDLNSSHVLPALIRKFHDAKLSGSTDVSVWGSGRPRREFLHVDDLASACVFLMENYDGEDAHQRRHRRRFEHQRAGGNDPRRRLSAGADCVRCIQARRPSAEAARRRAGCAISAGRRASRYGRESNRPTDGSSAIRPTRAGSPQTCRAANSEPDAARTPLRPPRAPRAAAATGP